MKKIIIWLVVFALLFVSGCQQNTNDDDEKEVSMRCIACRKVFSEEEINADFGLCRDCMLEAGATYCTKCNAPSYVKDMVAPHPPKQQTEYYLTQNAPTAAIPSQLNIPLEIAALAATASVRAFV